MGAFKLIIGSRCHQRASHPRRGEGLETLLVTFPDFENFLLENNLIHQKLK